MRSRNKYFDIRPIANKGLGAFAIRRIRSGTTVAEYTGEIITDAEADLRYPDDFSRPHHTFLFALDNGTCIDASIGGGDARYINHSCDPNCEAVLVKGRILIDVIRTIQPGEELAYDYQYRREGESPEEARRKFPCYCGSDNCRGTLVSLRQRRNKRPSKLAV